MAHLTLKEHIMSEKAPVSLWSPFQQYTDTFLNNPWTNWQRFFNPMATLNNQFFPINVNWRNEDDVEVEHHVISEVGSYGKQLSIIMDVIDVLMARLDKTDLTSRERYCLNRFAELMQEVDSAVADYHGPKDKGVTRNDIDRIIEELHLLQRTDPGAYREHAARLQQTLQPAEPLVQQPVDGLVQQ